MDSNSSHLHRQQETSRSSTDFRSPTPRFGFIPLVVILLSSGAFLPLLLHPGLVSTSDAPYLLVRLHQLEQALRAGTFPVRWMPDAAYGLGYPFFNFYAALPYYIATGIKWLGGGYLWALKLTWILGFLTAALAAYKLALALFRHPWAALLTALSYTYAPFHLVQVYVRADALSEFVAYAFFPLLLWLVLRLRERPTARRAAALAAAYAGLLLTHNISALVFTPFLALFGVVVGWEQRRASQVFPDFSPADRSQPCREQKLNAGFDRAYWLWGMAALALGLLLSMWFWGPALAERDLVHLEYMTTGYLHYSNHFRGTDLVQPRLFFDYRAGERSYAMGAVQVALTLLGAVALLAQTARRRISPWSAAFWLGMLAVTTFMITPLSRPLWDHLPLLPLVQFPWRFLSLQALAAAVVTGSLCLLVPSSPHLPVPLSPRLRVPLSPCLPVSPSPRLLVSLSAVTALGTPARTGSASPSSSKPWGWV